MKPKNYFLIGGTIVLLFALVILSNSLPNLTILNYIKDISIALTLSVSIAFNIKLNISYKKYETNIKEMIIQNQNNYFGNDKDARSKLLLDNDNLIISKLIDAYKHIELYFKQYDFSTPQPSALFDNVMNMCNGDFKDSTFRFSDSELDSLLKKLIASSEAFVYFMLDNIFSHNDRLLVTKYWDKRKEGYPDNELKELKAIDEKMYTLVEECINDYVNIIDLYYKKYTPRP
jgi:hypothetical protein